MKWSSIVSLSILLAVIAGLTSYSVYQHIQLKQVREENEHLSNKIDRLEDDVWNAELETINVRGESFRKLEDLLQELKHAKHEQEELR
jgi:hypothetical protein